MSKKTVTACYLVTGLALAVTAIGVAAANLRSETEVKQQWEIHDMDRPQPTIVDAGTSSTQHQESGAPSDAIVLFDGTDLSQWRTADRQPAKWKVEKGYVEVVAKSGSIWTKQAFGDCQLHVEWAAPVQATGEGQHRGNSGVFLMEKYEVQVLDSYDNKTYPDGQAAAIYGQYPPLVNACRPPGQWQTYEIIFRRPRFDSNGKLVRPGIATVLHNGVLVQDHVELTGPTAHAKHLPWEPHPDKLPLMLQDHSNPVRYRNIWIRELPDS